MKTRTPKAEKLGSEAKPKQTFSVEGEKIDVEACPKCKSELVVKTKDGIEYFECDDCKFIKHKRVLSQKEPKDVELKKKEKKEAEKEEKKEEKSEEFPDVNIGFDPFQQQN